MALVQFGGAEVGSSAEVETVNNASWSTTTVRTGVYSLRLNPSAQAGSAYIRGNAATGIPANFGITTSMWCGVAVRIATLPSSGTMQLMSIAGDQSSLAILCVGLSSTGLLSILDESGAEVDTGSTLSTGIWYYLELRGQRSDTGQYELRINGVSDMSGTCDQLTAFSDNFNVFRLGDHNVSATYDIFYDDWYVDNAAFQGSTTVLPEVRMLRPNANGDGTGWTGGTNADDFNEVDEVPPGSDGTEDTTYIEATATQDNTYSSFHQESTATRGVTGTIQAVMGFVRAKTGSVSGTSTVNIRMRNNTTNVDATGLELTTSYQTLRQLRTVDPNGGGAWTSGGVDSVQIGMNAGTLAQTQRFTVAYAMVLATVTPPITPTTASLTLTTFAPTVTVSAGSVTVTPTTASLTLTAFAPTVLTPVLVTPTTATLTTATFAPVIDLRVTIPVASLALTTFAPTVSTPVLVTPTTASLTLTTFAPSVAGGTGTTLTPTTASLTLTTFAPAVLTPVLATPATASLTLTTFAPTVTVDVRVTPTTATLALTAFAPTVLTPVLVTPTTASLTLTTFAPGVVGGAGLTVVPTTATLTLTTFAPTVTAAAPVLVTPLTANLITTRFAPTVLTPRLVTPTTAALLLTTFAPTIFLPILVTPTTAALVLTTFAPDAYASQPISETYIRMMGFDIEQLIALGFDRDELEAGGTDRNRMDLRGREL